MDFRVKLYRKHNIDKTENQLIETENQLIDKMDGNANTKENI